MQPILHFKSQSLSLRPSIFFVHSSVRDFSVCKNNSSSAFQWKISKSKVFIRSDDLSHFNLLSPSPLHELQKRTVAIAVTARKNRRRTTWRISRKMALECALFIASNLKLLPEPLDLIIKEGFGGGKGGGFGSWNGFGGGEFEHWGRRRRKFGNFGILLVFCALLLLLVLGKELHGLSDLVLGVGVLGILHRDRKSGIKGWILGFCSCALMVFLGMRREEFQRWVLGFRVRSPVIEFVRRKSRRRLL